jgi:2'-5' RNA ligase
MNNELRSRLIATPAVKLAGVSVGEHGSDDNIKILHSLAQRRRWIQEGKALSDGSFPIPNVQFLRFAMEGYEFAENKPKAKRWITRRAKSLAREHLLPQRWQKNAIVAAAEDAEVHTGAMIAIYPPIEIAELLAGPKATDEPAEELHVTLAFLGEADEYDSEARGRIAECIAAVCSQRESFEASVQGAGWFVGKEGGDGAPQWYSINGVGLARLRTQLVDRLSEFGIELPEDYDFVPHMTVRYGEPAVTEIPAGGEAKWSVDNVYLVMAGDRMEFPFNRPSEVSLEEAAPDIAEIVAPDVEETVPADDEIDDFGRLEKVPGEQNWIDRLPASLQARWHDSIVYRAAIHMHEERGMEVGHAIASALNWARHIARTGDVKQWDGPQEVNPQSVAECVAALALWQEMRAAAN